ncbi:bifunctional oligoribonuclease/PAP phosphatase NrnA [Balneolaceae bacterium ANBcel3]|nr:bifunctional oligoribonuclease/PAP phosphatase NrnA [Balneolaceae bacterium ANBcel3]
MKMVKNFSAELTKYSRIGLFSHINPDGDAIGSQLALSFWLEQQGLQTLLFNDDPVPGNMKWLEGSTRVEAPSEALVRTCDAFVLVDGNHPSRFGNMQHFLQETDKPVFLIDHHMDPPESFFHAMLWDPDASSTAFLVWRIFEESGLSLINRSVAEALYSGIMTDTGSFRFPTVTAGTHEAVASLLQYGKIRPDEVYSKIYEGKTLGQYQLLGNALNSIDLHEDGRVATMVVTQRQLEETGSTLEDLEGFVNYPLAIEGVLVSVFLYEKNGRIKVSLRGKSRVDLNKLARSFEGGGHFNAAGAWHPGPVEKATWELVAEISRFLNE